MIRKYFSPVLLAFVISSCTSGGFEKTETGLQYKFYSHNNGNKPKVGDILLLNMIYKSDSDSVLLNTKSITDSFRMVLKEPTFIGGIEEGFAMMSPGDSATFKISADSFFLKTIKSKIPKFIAAGSKLTFNVKLNRFITSEQYELEERREVQKISLKDDEMIQDFLRKNKLSAEPTMTGMYYIETKKGAGKKAEPGNLVRVIYSGKFFDGREFDKSPDKANPFSFRIGEKEVIKGWDEGIGMMSEGGKALLILPSRLAYGKRGSGPIPPNTPVMYEVELLEAKN
jgi:FKBP-type peptidyl-prolyl cis-trans isomerase